MTRSLAIAAALLAVLGVVEVQSTSASEAPYGEVTRFGGHDATGHTPGEFVVPVGFAVEPENPVTKETNDVYVLDRVRNHIEKGGDLGEGKAALEYRLQKLSDTGSVLGSTTFAEPYTDTNKSSDAHPLYGLAVDPAQKRVYTIAQSLVHEAESQNFVPVLDELVAWSTEPNAKGSLEGASGFAPDAVTKNASLIAGESVFLKSATDAAADFYAPEGLAVEGGSGDVMVEAQKGLAGGVDGPTVLEQISPGTGKISGSWQAGRVATANQQGGGIFAATNEPNAIGINLFDSATETVMRPAVISNDLKSEALIAADKSEGVNSDEAVGIDPPRTPNQEGAIERSALEPFTAGSPITQLTGAGDLYAALYAHEGGPSHDGQGEVEPWAAWVSGKAPSEAWMTGREGEGFDNAWAHMGVRLFEADGRIVNTLGGGEPKRQGEPQLGTCSIDFARASLAAGAGGTVFALTQPNTFAIGQHNERLVTDDEVIEFAPGGKYACPAAAEGHGIEVNGVEVGAKSGGSIPSVTVNAGVNTKFDAISLDRPLVWSPSWVFTWKPEPVEWTPFAFEWGWDFLKEQKVGPKEDGYSVIEAMSSKDSYLWPKPEAEHEYTKAGTYEARLRVYGDYGTSVFPIKVIVAGGGAPTASFTPPAHIAAGIPATFNAAASTPAPGGPVIEDYHWEFGDGSRPVNTNQRTTSHTFEKPGEYKVMLTVRDNEGTEKGASFKETVVVEPGRELTQPVKEVVIENPPVEEKPAALPASPTMTSGPTTKSSVAVVPKVAKKPLTKAQKLEAALKTCRKLKARKTRNACEREAHRRYGSSAKRDRKRK